MVKKTNEVRIININLDGIRAEKSKWKIKNKFRWNYRFVIGTSVLDLHKAVPLQVGQTVLGIVTKNI